MLAFRHPLQLTKSLRVAGSHNYSRSAPALQSNVDLLSAKGSKEPIDSSHVSILAY